MPHVLIIAGPTGSGESTITKALLKKYPTMRRLVTATTRPPRLNEKHAVDYYFFSEDEFKREMTKGNILEHTFVPGRSVYYGTYKPDLEKQLRQGFIVVVNPDVVGARFYKEQHGAVTVFIKTVSLDVLEQRLKKRDPSIPQEELKSRLDAAQYELDNEEGFYDYVVINEDGKLEEAVHQVEEIMKKEGYQLEA
jgi:guanylate kinase